MSKVEEIQELVRKLNEASVLYYCSNDSDLSDEEYDMEYARLEKLEKETGIVFHNSPTHHVGSLIPSENKRQHTVPMLSLGKVNSEHDLNKWLKPFGKQDVSAELKYDGMSAELVYKEGILTEAITRGTGTEGNSIYHHVFLMDDSVPKKLKDPVSIEVRGEIIASRKAFTEYNKMQTIPLKNERNATAGALNGAVYEMVENLKLSFIAYEIGSSEVPFRNKNEMLTFFKNNGFNIMEQYHWAVNDIVAAMDIARTIEHMRDSLDFLIDGIVFKLCDFEERKKLGATDKHPRWAIAYKFASDGDWTTLNEVTWEVARSGKLTPVAHFVPIQIGGVTISKATLNNYEFITGSDIQLHDELFVVRANDVIPKVQASRHTDESQPVPYPSKCPVCGGVTARVGSYTKCTNPECKPQLIAKLEHFCSRGGMDIRSLGGKLLEQIVDGTGIKNVYELLTLEREQLEALGFSRARCDKIMQELNLAKGRPLGNVLYALGIDGLGKGAADRLGSYYVSFNNLISSSIHDFGKILNSQANAKRIWHYLKEDPMVKNIRAWLK